MYSRLSAIGVFVVLVLTLPIACDNLTTDPAPRDSEDIWASTPPEGDQGCTPGYWKNHLDAWHLTSLSPDQSVDTVFGQMWLYPDLADATLLEALNFGGGPGIEGAVKILLRSAVAAVLNAIRHDVAHMLPLDVLSMVNTALTSQDRATILETATYLDNRNNGGCPLN